MNTKKRDGSGDSPGFKLKPKGRVMVTMAPQNYDKSP